MTFFLRPPSDEGAHQKKHPEQAVRACAVTLSTLTLASCLDSVFTYSFYVRALALQNNAEKRTQVRAMGWRAFLLGFPGYAQGKIISRWTAFGSFAFLSEGMAYPLAASALGSAWVETVATNQAMFCSRMRLLAWSKPPRLRTIFKAPQQQVPWFRFLYGHMLKNSIHYLALFGGREQGADFLASQGWVPEYEKPVASAFSGALVQPFTSFADAWMTQLLKKPSKEAFYAVLALPLSRYGGVIGWRSLMMFVGYGVTELCLGAASALDRSEASEPSQVMGLRSGPATADHD